MMPFFTYKPQSLSELVGQDDALKQIRAYFTGFQKGKGLFLYGPPGTGKTSAVYAYAKENNYDILELNASDGRNQAILKDFLSRTTGQASLFGNKKIILLDEVDGLSGKKDRGAPSIIVDFISKSTFPIVMTGVDVFDKKFSKLKKASLLVPFISVRASEIVSILDSFCKKENLSLDIKDIKAIARNANGDVRAALNDLFSFAVIKESTVDDMSLRRQTQEIGDVLVRVFKSTDPDVVFGAYDLIKEDLDKIFLWVDENLPRDYSKSKDLARAYETLSLADKFFGRIRRWQYYRYYVYCYLLLSVGIALSKDEKSSNTPNYRQPTRLLRYWQANMAYAKRKSIVQKLAMATKVSEKRALQDTFPLLLPALASNTLLQEEMELTDDEVVWLQKQIK